MITKEFNGNPSVTLRMYKHIKCDLSGNLHSKMLVVWKSTESSGFRLPFFSIWTSCCFKMFYLSDSVLSTAENCDMKGQKKSSIFSWCWVLVWWTRAEIVTTDFEMDFHPLSSSLPSTSATISITSNKPLSAIAKTFTSNSGFNK